MEIYKLDFLFFIFTLFRVSFGGPIGVGITDLATERFDVHPINREQFGVYGGHNITINKARYVGTILTPFQELIGTATILNNRWILTSAFDLNGKSPQDVDIRIGSSYSDKGGHLVEVNSIFIHAAYKGAWDYNIALAKLKRPLKFSKTVGSISISTTKLPKNGAIGVSFGFGVTEQNSSELLRQVSLPIFDYTSCKDRLPPAIFSNLSFCTSKYGAGPCANDYGSPLIYKNKVIGVFSGAYYGCGTPSSFANVFLYRDWIQSTIKNFTEEGEILEHDEDIIEDN